MHCLETLRRINRNPKLARQGLSCTISTRGNWSNRPPLAGDWRKPAERAPASKDAQKNEAGPESKVRKRKSKADATAEAA